ncbi:MAG: FAD-dependent oxidoreductase [Bacteroidales bacterium]
MSETINIILNGKRVTGFENETILDLARRKAIEIPTLCYDPRLQPYSSCYVCVVEVEGMNGMQPSCSTMLREGMKIHTDNDNVIAARKAALDLLLSNHYADCVAPCKEECPAGVDVQGYISLIEKGLYHDAVALIKETNPFPAVCGRVCVRPCELACRRNLLDEPAPVGIDYLKRFAADKDLLEAKKHYKPVKEKFKGKRVAIIGGGPGGLSAAYFLQPKGYQCDIFEANKHAGGWLRYGIPEYRLPNDVLDKEIKTITELGAKIFYNKKLGENLHYENLNEDYDAVILAIGSQRGTLLGAEGEDAENVYSGIDFLRNMEQTGQKYDFSGKKVAVVGGGNTAMDCCRTAVRCEAEKVYVVYRRAEEQMPANPIEVHESKLEGVEYLLLTNPVKVNKDKTGKVKSMTLIRMELGEPDASGRRRPVPVEGSEFELEIDYVLAAIGQKTQLDFLEEINRHASHGKLKLNRWGDIDADPNTLQTGIPEVFAAGDGVTGPATVIEAINQAKIAARSVEQYLKGQPLKEPPKPFISKKDNFKEQKKEDYAERYRSQLRYEMPVLEPEKRNNFDEVELGYQDEEKVIQETSRCLECGCIAFFDCELQKHASTYHAEQLKFKGDFNEYAVNFEHPYVEIDNNKCVLCSKCVRVCEEIVGAKALGLVNRGFDTLVEPAMGERLQDTYCESCGMCISACPTGAITENVPFKPGPVKTDPIDLICNYCSVGCEISLHHKSGFVMSTTGKNEGLVNKHGAICRFPMFGYHYINDPDRLTRPWLKKEGKFVEISFEEAYKHILERIKNADRNENAFFAGARLSNEEQYLIQKLARGGVKTNNIDSFHYLARGDGYRFDSMLNVPLQEIQECKKIYLMGAELNMDNAVVGFMVNQARSANATPVAMYTKLKNSKMKHKVDELNILNSYYHFVRAANYYILKQNLLNEMFVKDRTEGFEEYKQNLMQEKFTGLLEVAGVSEKFVEAFVHDFNEQMNAILIAGEKHLPANAMAELRNLMMLTGKLGKTASGMISLKEKNNSQGLFDMGIGQNFGVGAEPVGENQIQMEKMADLWKVNDLPGDIGDPLDEQMEQGKIKNLFIFGEDPLGCAIQKDEVKGWLQNAGFVVVQDYFMSETAEMADLVMPATLPHETGGSFTNAEKTIQTFQKNELVPSKVKHDNVKQLLELHKAFGMNNIKEVHDAFMEAVSLLPASESAKNIPFQKCGKDGSLRIFDYGCDYVVKRFEKEFNGKLRS